MRPGHVYQVWYCNLIERLLVFFFNLPVHHVCTLLVLSVGAHFDPHCTDNLTQTELQCHHALLDHICRSAMSAGGGYGGRSDPPDR